MNSEDLNRHIAAISEDLNEAARVVAEELNAALEASTIAFRDFLKELDKEDE